jgi:small subunit ribosomal protein S6e
MGRIKTFINPKYQILNMVDKKIVIGNSNGKSYQKVIESTEPLIGRSIGENLKGDLIGFPGYEFMITGGSDVSGFPMRKDIKGARRVKILANSGVGVKVKRRGLLIRKTVAGNTIGEKTIQINLKVEKQGTKKLEEIFNSKEEAKPEEKKETKEDKSSDKKN